MAKKKKKNFKDVTGIKFADLLLPALVGGIGSYSNAAGRGVGLGLQALRTFQAGKQYSDEQDVAKRMAEMYGGKVSAIEDEINALKDESMASVKRIDGQGAVLPDPERPIGEGALDDVDTTGTEQRFLSLFGQQGAAPESMFGDPQALLDGMSQEQALAQSGKPDLSAGIGPIELQDPEALLDAKRRQDEIARDIEIMNDRKSFYDIAQLTAEANPSTAGYMGLVEQNQRISEKAKTDAMLTNARLLSEGRQESYYYDIAKETHSRMGQREQALLESRLRADFSPMITKDANGNDVTWSVNKKTGEWAMTSSVDSSKMGLQDLSNLPLETRMELFDKASKAYKSLITTDSDSGGVDKGLISNYKFMLSSLWSSMQNPSDITGLSTMLNQFNAMRQQQGLEPLTMDEWLKESGLTVGVNGKPLGSGDGGGAGGGDNPYEY